MVNRQSLRTRREDTSVGLRSPTTQDSALRSDFFYIPQELADATVKLITETVNHRTVRVSFDPTALPVDPTFGNYVEVQVLRSGQGIPQTNLDGLRLLSRTATSLVGHEGYVTLIDEGLTPGRWVYYSLFVKYVSGGNTHWLRIGEQSVLLPEEFGYADRLWRMIPEWYRRADSEGIGAANTLRRLINAIGYETDLHRTWVSQVGKVWEIESVSSRLLDEIGETLGHGFEEASGGKRFRNLLADMILLRKRKGTAGGIEGFLTGLTGYRTVVYSGPNILLTSDDSEAAISVGRWKILNSGQATLSRQVSASSPAGGPPVGATFLRATSTLGGSQNFGMELRNASTTDVSGLVPVRPNKTYKIGVSMATSLVGRDGYVTVTFKNKYGSTTGSVTQTASAISSTWKRFVLSFTAPVNSYYAMITVGVSGTTAAVAATFDIWRMIMVDTAWRPVAVPGTTTVAPLSGTHPGYYDDVNYYEEPRTTWINVYPQRANLALNSDFALNNSPAGAWVSANEPTYALLAQAYASYDALSGAKPTYDSIMAGFGSGAWGLSFDTANRRLVAQSNSAINGAWYTQVSSHLFPVHNLLGMSAAILASTNAGGAGAKMRLRMQWYSANDTSTRINDANGNPVEHVSPEITINTTRGRVALTNATPPANARYGRLVLDTQHTGTHTVYYEKALIENNPDPGPYFDGSFTDGEYGDFFFTGSGAAWTNPSAYYMSYRSFLSGPGGTDRLATIMAELMPSGREYKFLTAQNGLYW